MYALKKLQSQFTAVLDNGYTLVKFLMRQFFTSKTVRRNAMSKPKVKKS